MYKQAIIIFGIVVPGGILLLALVIIWTMLENFETQRDSRIAAFEMSKVSAVKEKALEGKLTSRRGRMAYWNDHLGRDVIQSFNENLEAALSRFDSNQLRMAAASRPTGEGGVGKEVGADASRFKLTFEGGYGPMQEMLAELELRMPQLLLEQMKISPGSGRGRERNLTFEVSYTAWNHEGSE